IKGLTMDNPEEGETVRGSVDIANSGFDAAEGLTLRVKDESGNVLLEEKDITLGSGENSGYGFEYTLPETKDGSARWNITAELLQGENAVSEKTLSGTITAQAVLDTFSVTQSTSRD